MVTVKTIASGVAGVDAGVEETRLLTRGGMVTVRHDNMGLRLGLSQVSDPDEEPEVEILLTDRQIRGLVEELKWHMLQGSTP